MIEAHLYGSLRRFAAEADVASDSIATASWNPGDTVRSVCTRIGVPIDELGSNLFLNGRYATLDAFVADGDRLGLFPVDMQLLYKWYFAPQQRAEGPDAGRGGSEGKEGPRK